METEDEFVGFHISPPPSLPSHPKLGWQVESHLRELCEKSEIGSGGGKKRNSTAKSALLCEYLGSVAPWSSCHCCHASLSHEIGNTEKYKSWHCRISVWHWARWTNRRSLHMQALTGVHTKQWLFVESAATETKEKRPWMGEFFVLLTILSNNPDLHLLLLICDGRELGLCINYSLFARSAPGPEDMGNYSSCRRSRWTPVDKETCWWGHRAHISPPKKHSHLHS